MARWKPGAPERLQEAALDLFAARGYEQTTATDIAQAVGLTERTFFRHFSDKREVLFHGQDRFVEMFLRGVEAAPPDASPVEVVAATLRSAAEFFPDERRSSARTRQSVIDRNPALQERELHKLAGLATTIAGALRARGTEDLAAALAGQLATSVFLVAFGRWLRDGEQRSLADLCDDTLHALLALTAPS